VSLQVANMIKYSLLPELSRAFGSGDLSLARKMHRYAWQASLALSVGVGTTTWIGGPMIYRAWIHRNVAFDARCFHILLVAMVANCLWETSSVISISMNGHFSIALAYTGMTLCSLALAWFLLPRYGIAGAAIALLTVDLSMTVIVLLKSLSLVQDKLQRFLMSAFSMPDFRSMIETPEA
jgi:O-antigen/teichoic acid export membrane protein